MRRSTFSLVLAAPLALAACGGGAGRPAASPPAAPEEVLVRAASRTATAGSFRVHYTFSSATGGVEASGLFDPASRRGRLTFVLSSPGPPGGGRWGPVEAWGAGGAGWEAVSDGDVVYLRTPPGVGVDEPWLRVDIRRLAGSAGLDLEWLRRTGGDPSGPVGLLWGARDARRVGVEEVRDVPTTRYAALLDPRRAVEVAPPERRDDAVAAAAGVDAAVPAEAWVDDDGRLRRLRYTADVAGGPGPVAATYELHDFGVDARVLVPPPEDTADLAELVGATG